MGRRADSKTDSKRRPNYPTTYSPAADAPRSHHDTPSRATRPSLVGSPAVSAGRPSGPFVVTTQPTRRSLYDRVCSMA